MPSTSPSSRKRHVPEDFFKLDLKNRRDLLLGAQEERGLNARILEKDAWVCWTLEALFTMPDAPQMAFKGGTSLSKAYGVIQRFSEDVDITLNPNHPAIAPDFDPMGEGGRNKRKRLGERVDRENLPRYIQEQLQPYLERYIRALPSDLRPSIDYDPAAHAALHIRYPSALERSGSQPEYLQEHVLVELGVRATTEPSARRTIRPYLYDLDGLDAGIIIPTPNVDTLSAERTFWEKVTLMHYENTRSDGFSVQDRIARHWYDVHHLDNHPTIGPSARAAAAIRDAVIDIKRTHYSGKQVNYEQCRRGQLRMTPNPEAREALKADYAKMVNAGMFFDSNPPTMDEILNHTAELEETLNQPTPDDES